MKKIIALHGWTYSVEKWKPLIKELKENNISVEMLNIPGLTAPLDRVWDIDDYVNWLNGILIKEKNEVILLGHSNGGLISMAYILKYPERIKQLILIDSTAIYHDEISIRFKRFVFSTAAKIGKRLTNSQVLKKLLYRAARVHDYEKAVPIVQKTMINLIKTDLKLRLPEIKIPTIIIWGEKDSVTPISDGKIIHERISKSKLFIIPKARHSPQLTNYKEVAELIVNNL